MTKISTYAQAGVDRTQEEKAVSSIVKLLNQQPLGNLSGFFANGVQFGNYFLTMSTDGVGSKVLVAELLQKFDTVGIDCVAMNVNDLITVGSIPQAFVDYIAIRKPDEKKIQSIVKGLLTGCAKAEIPLIGGETAILPDLLAGDDNHFDLAGTALEQLLTEAKFSTETPLLP